VIERKKKKKIMNAFGNPLSILKEGNLFRLLRQFERGKFQHLNQYRNNKNARHVMWQIV